MYPPRVSGDPNERLWNYQGRIPCRMPWHCLLVLVLAITEGDRDSRHDQVARGDIRHFGMVVVVSPRDRWTVEYEMLGGGWAMNGVPRVFIAAITVDDG